MEKQRDYNRSMVNRLKPWTSQTINKNDTICDAMLQNASLIALYKCMGDDCKFTSYFPAEMELHLTQHTHELMLDSFASTRLLACAYCTTSTASTKSLVEHIGKVHGQCRYQCIFCFYRAFDVGNVFNHQQYYHDNVNVRNCVQESIIVLPLTQKQLQTDYLIEICTSFQNKYNMLRCSFCSTTHASIGLFLAHIKAHHLETNVECPVCGHTVVKSGMEDHIYYHREALKCLYCPNWCRSEAIMARHLSNVHCTKALYYGLKLRRCNNRPVVFMLEKLEVHVPESQLLVATNVSGRIMLTSNVNQTTCKIDSSRSEQQNCGFLKIVRVQGGVRIAEDGAILANSECAVTFEPEKGTAVPVPVENDQGGAGTSAARMIVSNSIASSNTDRGVKLIARHAKSVAAPGPLKSVKVLSNSHCKKTIPRTNGTSAVRPADVAGLEATHTPATEAKNVVAVPSVTALTTMAVSTPSDRASAMKNVRLTVTSENNIDSMAVKSAPVSGVSRNDVMNMKTHNPMPPLKGVKHAAGVSNSATQRPCGFIPPHKLPRNVLVTSTAVTGSEVRQAATIPPVVHKTIVPEQTGKKSILDAAISSNQPLANGSGKTNSEPTVPPLGRVVKNPLGTVENNFSKNPTVSRKLVKLKRLANGSLVLNLSTNSNATTNTTGPPVNKYMGLSVIKLKPVASPIRVDMIRIPRPNDTPAVSRTDLGTTAAAGKVINVAPQTMAVSTKFPSNALAKDWQKKRSQAAVTPAPPPPAVAGTGASGITAGVAAVPAPAMAVHGGGEKSNVSAQNAVAKDARNHRSAAAGRCAVVCKQTSEPNSTNVVVGATSVTVKNGPDLSKLAGNVKASRTTTADCTAVRNMPVWHKYGVELFSLNVNKLPFADNIQMSTGTESFNSSLEWLMSLQPMNETACFVCGATGCSQRFSLVTKLMNHMKQHHPLLRTSIIACQHCDCVLYGIESYCKHLSIHLACRFVCFLCRYWHFLLPNVVHHLEGFHSCKKYHLCFAHRRNINPLTAIILLMPNDMPMQDVLACVNRTVMECSTAKLSNSPWHPKYASIDELYRCGFCSETLTNIISLKKHILSCDKQQDVSYPCAHCEMRFLNWSKVLDEICRHLYFHGENLYACGMCGYKHFMKFNVLEHIKKHHTAATSITVKAIRESQCMWKCSLCPFQSMFQQAVMSHMQHVHNLPGERFLCSLCGDRTLTKHQAEVHVANRHHEPKLVLIEMYHSRAEPDDCHKYSTASNIQTRRLSKADVHILKGRVRRKRETNDPDAPQLAPNEPGMDDRIMPNKIAPNDCQPGVSIPAATEQKEEPLLSNSHKRTHAQLTGDDAGHDQCSLVNEHQAKRIKKEANNTEQEEQTPDTLATVSPTLEGPEDEHDKRRGSMEKQKEVHVSGETTTPDVGSSWSDSTYTPSNRSLKKCVPSSPPVNRRSSRRAATKPDAYDQWHESVQYRCWVCQQLFSTWSELESHASANMHHADGEPCSTGNWKRFRLVPLARCFYCPALGTCAALVQHCRSEHPADPFLCVDRSDSLKCGLCVYRNESDDSGQFRCHFQAYHGGHNRKLDYYEHASEDSLWWSLSLGKNTPFDGLPEEKIDVYMCHICNKMLTSELCMGTHVAKHVLTFSCPSCSQEFHAIKALYYHFLVFHRTEEMVLSSMYPTECTEHLLDVLMLFQNGLIVAKREAQYTSVARLRELMGGVQRYYNTQLRALDSYKKQLSKPLCYSDAAGAVQQTCKSFILAQTACPMVVLPRLTSAQLAMLQNNCHETSDLGKTEQ